MEGNSCFQTIDYIQQIINIAHKASTIVLLEVRGMDENRI